MSYPGPPLKSAVQQAWARLGEGALDLVYPRSCHVCQVGLEDSAPRVGLRNWLCQTCHEDLVRIEAPYCAVCGEPFAEKKRCQAFSASLPILSR